MLAVCLAGFMVALWMVATTKEQPDTSDLHDVLVHTGETGTDPVTVEVVGLTHPVELCGGDRLTIRPPLTVLVARGQVQPDDHGEDEQQDADAERDASVAEVGGRRHWLCRLWRRLGGENIWGPEDQ